MTKLAKSENVVIPKLEAEFADDGGIRINAHEISIDLEPYVLKTPIDDLLILKRPYFSDKRGSFQEIYRKSKIEQALGRIPDMSQGSIAISGPNSLKGFHAEDQDKLVTPLTGKLVAVWVDLRTESKTFKKWLMMDFDYMNNKGALTSVFIPNGCGNSYAVYKDSDSVRYFYQVSKEYNSSTKDMGVRYDDPDLAIPWPINNPVLSERDVNMLSLKQFLRKYR